MTPSLEDDVLAQHVIEAGFLWILRDQATTDAAYDLARLTELDERVEANVDGLRLAGDRGWEHALAAVDGGESGEVFTAATLAIARADIEGVARVLDAIEGDAGLARGIVSAFGWSPLEEMRELLPGLLDINCPAELHCVGIAACSAHRDDPSNYIAMAIGSDDPRVRARAFRAAGRLGRMEVLPALIAELGASNADLRYAAASSAAMFRNPGAIDALDTFARQGDARAEEAADLLARALDPHEAQARLQGLARSGSAVRAAIRGVMALGDPVMVPWLLECSESEDHARAAAWAVTTLTGWELVDQRSRVAPPPNHKQGPTEDPTDPDVAMDPDESLEWPDASKLKRSWDRERGRFQRGKRYLLGRELGADQLSRALVDAKQPIRRGVALELAIRSPGSPIFPTSAPGFRQRGAL